MRFFSWLVVNTLALGAAVWLLEGITLTGSSDGDVAAKLLVVGVIFGLVTAFVRPLLRFLSFPLIVLTLGLMLLVINAFMLLLTSKIADVLNLDFHVDGFWVAVIGSIVISLASMLLEAILPSRDRY